MRSARPWTVTPATTASPAASARKGLRPKKPTGFDFRMTVKMPRAARPKLHEQAKRRKFNSDSEYLRSLVTQDRRKLGLRSFTF